MVPYSQYDLFCISVAIIKTSRKTKRTCNVRVVLLLGPYRSSRPREVNPCTINTGESVRHMSRLCQDRVYECGPWLELAATDLVVPGPLLRYIWCKCKRTLFVIHCSFNSLHLLFEFHIWYWFQTCPVINLYQGQRAEPQGQLPSPPPSSIACQSQSHSPRSMHTRRVTNRSPSPSALLCHHTVREQKIQYGTGTGWGLLCLTISGLGTLTTLQIT